MGRPLNKRYFGAPTASGNEIKVQFHNGTGSVNGWIVKQLGSKKFRCTDGSNTADCILVDKASASLLAGEMSITVLDDAATPRQVLKIAARKVTHDAGAYAGWTFSDSAIDGRVEMEEAGNTAAVVTTGNFVVGVEYQIVNVGDTDFTLIGAASNTPGIVFTATGVGGGTTGTAITTANAQADDFEGDDV